MEYDYHSLVILSGRSINDSMPKHVAEMTIKALNNIGKVIKGSKVLIMGLTYKENVRDTRESPVTDMIKELRDGREPSPLFNTFENVTFTRSSELSTYRSHLIKIGAKEVHLAGSGPVIFTLIKDKTEAEDLYTRCKNQGMETYLVETVWGVEE